MSEEQDIVSIEIDLKTLKHIDQNLPSEMPSQILKEPQE